MSREIMQQALDALQIYSTASHKIQDAIKALKAELAKPEQEELIQFKDGKWSYVKKPWVGLTNDEVEFIADSEWEEAFVRLIEAKLKEKNSAL
jgi:hypothetical protein